MRRDGTSARELGRFDLENEAPQPRPTRGRPALKGKRVLKLGAVPRDPATVWTKVMLAEWYGGHTCRLEYASATAHWSKAGLPPQPIRWVLVRDRTGTGGRERLRAALPEMRKVELRGLS